MTETTPLDRAHAQMQNAPNDDAARLRFFERIADGELFLLLEEEPKPEGPVTPRLFEVEDQKFALVFDREGRLADFAGAAPYVAMSGRVLVEMIAGSGIGLGLNLSVAPSEYLLPAQAVDWLHSTLGNTPQESQARPEEIAPPHGLPEVLITALDTKLALAAGLAKLVYLAGVTYEGGLKSHLLAFVDPVPGSEDALARLVSEALIFSGVEAGVLDVAFFKASDPICASFARFGLRFDLPDLAREQSGPAAPGMDPDTPPKLR
ncbi:SseB family protein [Celeribacter arenosi]|uniref:SseB family protein n=1 Tax=Celeribacter arenosi TaxID=792649 RepID=A0ABP7K683_9RHOB